MNNPLNVIFMGTPDFAVPCLNALDECNCRIELVVTQPDRPRGRGRRIEPPPVKKAAAQKGVDVVQPEAVNTDEFYTLIRQREPDLFVVVAFGHILPKKLLEMPTFGAINLHASLLPQYRGPAPIQWAIINGETETGVTSMLMDKGLDTGEMLFSEKIPILPDDTAGTLHDKLSVLSGEVLVKTINALESGSIRPMPQNHAEATYAPMLKKSDGRIDWTKPAAEIERFIRGMTPWPGAYTFMGGKRMRLFKSRVAGMTENRPAGSVIRSFDDELRVACGKDALCILEIQPDSGKRMDIAQFLKGQQIPPGTVFS